MKLKIKVIPGSKEEKIIEGNPAIIRIKARAENNKANIAVIKFLSRYLKKNVRITKGLTSKNKIIEY